MQEAVDLGARVFFIYFSLLFYAGRMVTDSDGRFSGSMFAVVCRRQVGAMSNYFTGNATAWYELSVNLDSTIFQGES